MSAPTSPRGASPGVVRTLLAATALLAAAALLLALTDAGSGAGGSAGLEVLAVVPLLGAITTLGALIASRTGNTIGWLLLAAGLGGALVLVGEQVVMGLSTTGLASLPGVIVLAVAFSAFSPLLVWAPLLGLLLLFPDGRLPSRRWLPVGVLTAAVLLGQLISGLLHPGPVAEGLAPNPLGWHGGATVLKAIDDLMWIAGQLCLLLAAASLVARYRSAAGVARQQLRYLALSGALTVAGVAALLLVHLTGVTAAPVHWAPGVLIAAGLGSIPITATLAILRYRLYDIDRILSRTVSWASITGVLVVSYVLSVMALGALLRGLGASGDLAVAGSTLVVAALFHPVRRRVQAGVDRRFNRARYDAQRTVEEFRHRLRGEVHLDEVAAELLDAVGDTVQPAGASLWLREAVR